MKLWLAIPGSAQQPSRDRPNTCAPRALPFACRRSCRLACRGSTAEPPYQLMRTPALGPSCCRPPYVGSWDASRRHVRSSMNLRIGLSPQSSMQSCTRSCARWEIHAPAGLDGAHGRQRGRASPALPHHPPHAAQRIRSASCTSPPQCRAMWWSEAMQSTTSRRSFTPLAGTAARFGCVAVARSSSNYLRWHH